MAGILLFGMNTQKFRPFCIVKAVSFVGNELTVTEYRDSEDITGNLFEQYKNARGFILRNLKKVQDDQHFNSLGRLEIPKILLFVL